MNEKKILATKKIVDKFSQKNLLNIWESIMVIIK